MSIPTHSPFLLEAAIAKCESMSSEANVPQCVTDFIASEGNVQDCNDLKEVVMFSKAFGTTVFEGATMGASPSFGSLDTPRLEF